MTAGGLSLLIMLQMIVAAIIAFAPDDGWKDRWDDGYAIPWSEVLAVLFWPVGMPIKLLVNNHQRHKRLKARTRGNPPELESSNKGPYR